jgi:hypothetical protein
MIRLDEAAKGAGRRVIYNPQREDGTKEYGLISSANQAYVFVVYDGDTHAKATHPDSLDWADPPKPLRAEDIIEDIYTEVDNFNRQITRDPEEALRKIEAICTRWGEAT